MHMIAVVDDANGLLFHHRRQSQDRALRQRILALTAGSSLWMNAYTFGQFRERSDSIRVDEQFMQKAKPGDYCFVETLPLLPYQDQIESIILFRWNRRYPGDVYLDISLPGVDWILTSSESFAGSSHALITQEVYIRK